MGKNKISRSVIEYRTCGETLKFRELPDGSLLPESLWDASTEFPLGISVSSAG